MQKLIILIALVVLGVQICMLRGYILYGSSIKEKNFTNYTTGKIFLFLTLLIDPEVLRPSKEIL